MGRTDVGPVTNSQAPIVERYQKAFVSRSVYVTSDHGGRSYYLTHFFSVYFVHRVEGLLEDKRNINRFGMNRLFELKMQGNWYFTTPQEFKRASPGKRLSLYVAGPVNNWLEDCP